MNKHKAKAARLRELKRKENEEESKRLADNWKRLTTMTLGLSQGTNTGRVSGGKLHESNVPKSLVVKPYRRETIEIKSHPCTTDFSKIEKRVIAHMTDEMIEREAKAQKEIQKKKNRVGILVNKSGYQYISDGMDPKTLGRK